MPDRILRTADDVADFCSFLHGANNLPLTVSWVQGADRSQAQNRLMWKWASEVGSQTYSPPHEVQARWKLEHGVPILRAADDEYRETYDLAIRPQPYAVKIRLMEQGYPVTSVMKTRQMTMFLDKVAEECAQNGLQITQPDADLAGYMAKHRTVWDD